MKKIIIAAVCGAIPFIGSAQSALDAFSLSRSDLKGTARFMSMGGAFGALGGDLSTLNQNPGGIGVYRSNDIGVTLGIDFQRATSITQGMSELSTQTKFNCNNFGYIGSVYTGSEVMPFFNWGASYSRTASFDRAFRGGINALNGSLSNLIAGITSDEWTPGDLGAFNKDYNPFFQSNASWNSIMAYNSYLINPVAQDPASLKTKYNGLWQNGTSGYGSYDVVEKGYVDEYSINFGGNIMDLLYWGVGFGITDISYSSSTYYTEDFQNALIPTADAKDVVTGNGGFGLESLKHISGSGFNFKTGIIVRPINELRLGLAVHTPTYYNLTQEGWAQIDYGYSSGANFNGVFNSDDGGSDYHEWKLHTPWRLIVSAAGVIGSQAILSVDYEYRPYQNMSIRDDRGNIYKYMDNDVDNYYQSSNILRLGAEYRLTRNVSARLGYSYESTPVKGAAYEGREFIYTEGPDDTEMTPLYTFDKNTSYITAGLGYRYNGFYVDAAYVYKHRESKFNTFTPNDFTQPTLAKITDSNSQIVLSLGFRF